MIAGFSIHKASSERECQIGADDATAFGSERLARVVEPVDVQGAKDVAEKNRRRIWIIGDVRYTLDRNSDVTVSHSNRLGSSLRRGLRDAPIGGVQIPCRNDLVLHCVEPSARRLVLPQRVVGRTVGDS